MRYGKLIFIGLILLCSTRLCLADEAFVQRDDVKAFINMMVTEHHFDRAKLTDLFTRMQLRPEVIATLEKPYEAKPWYIYRKHFISDARVNGGVKFWHLHHRALAKAEQQYGVPAKIIVAIIGVESFYGEQRGKFPVLGTLATIGFNYPKRETFFKKELAQFLILCREQGWDPEKIMGSYAGAVGQPQFMPSSYRAYAISFDQGNKQVDLFDNLDDIISSIANYLSKHGWESGEVIYTRAHVTGNSYQQLDFSNRKPKMTLKELATYGIKPAGSFSPDTKAFLFSTEASEGQTEFWLGFNNFYAITRYNGSNLYALAVSQLANNIQHAYYHPQNKTAADQ